MLLCSHSPNDVPREPQRNVSIAAVRGAVRPFKLNGALKAVSDISFISEKQCRGIVANLSKRTTPPPPPPKKNEELSHSVSKQNSLNRSSFIFPKIAISELTDAAKYGCVKVQLN